MSYLTKHVCFPQKRTISENVRSYVFDGFLDGFHFITIFKMNLYFLNIVLQMD